MPADAMGSLSGGSYRAPGTVTGSRASNFTPTDPAPYPADTGINRHAATKVYDAHDQAGETQVVDASTLSPVDPPPHAPSYWPSDKDAYRNNGVTGQEFLNNIDHQ